jgi:hypothetical protein
MDYEITIAAGRIAGDLPADSEIEALALETRAPRELIRALYTAEHAKLQPTAKIKTYVPVLIRRRVKALLRKQRLS